MDDGNTDDGNTDRPRPHVPWSLLRPGYFRCKRTIERLRKFRALAIHHDRWGAYIDSVPPLEDLIGPAAELNNPIKQHLELERQLAYLAMPVCRDLEVCGVTHVVNVKDPYAPEKEPRRLSVITNFTQFPEGQSQRRFEALIQRIDFAIGQYEDRKRAAVRDWFSPVFWLGVLLRVPVRVYEYAGFIRTEDDHSGFVKVYNYATRVLIITILVFLATWAAKKAGVTMPWDVITHFVKP
jgi:hypothetical protein